jgi:ADP-ribosylglycohydrolase
VQQVNASWDAVSREIANQNYDNAVRAWFAVDQAQRQAQMNEAVRKEYARRAYLAQEALREKAQTDAKAREAYQALGRVMMGR